jgi:hypothetical protein
MSGARIRLSRTVAAARVSQSPRTYSSSLEIGSVSQNVFEETVLIQVNDRTPQHLFPELDERGLEYESKGEDTVYTAI